MVYFTPLASGDGDGGWLQTCADALGAPTRRVGIGAPLERVLD